MKPRPAFLSLTSFCLAFAGMLWWKSVHPPAPALAAASPESAAIVAPLPVASRVEATSPTAENVPAPALPYLESEEERLLALCWNLAASDPEAAFRAGMARWGFDGKALAAAARELVKKDPAAARRLLADCPDLRSKNVLECELMADELSRDPQGKLRWAEANLEGYVRIRAMNAGMAALAVQDPEAAMDILVEWPPSLMKLNGQIKAISSRMKEDPAAALLLAAENVSPSDKELIGLASSVTYLKNNPGEGLTILPRLPLEYQEYMGLAIAAASKRDSAQSLPQLIDTIRSLPGEIQTPVIRLLGMSFETGAAGEGKNKDNFLASLTAPAERAAVIEVMAVERLSYFGQSKNQTEILDSRSQFQTPEDKQSVARVVPYLMDLTEVQRGEILARLK